MSIETIRELETLASVCPELNMANYTEDDVRHLNDWAIEMSLLADKVAALPQAEAPQPATPKPVGFTYRTEIEYADFTGRNGSFWRVPPDLDDEAVPLYDHSAPSVPATPEPVAWLDEMLADTREVFDANGSETPQVVRDVIEYVASWVTVHSEKNRPVPAAQPAPSVPDYLQDKGE